MRHGVGTPCRRERERGLGKKARIFARALLVSTGLYPFFCRQKGMVFLIICGEAVFFDRCVLQRRFSQHGFLPCSAPSASKSRGADPRLGFPAVRLGEKPVPFSHLAGERSAVAGRKYVVSDMLSIRLVQAYDSHLSIFRIDLASCRHLECRAGDCSAVRQQEGRKGEVFS